MRACWARIAEEWPRAAGSVLRAEFARETCDRAGSNHLPELSDSSNLILARTVTYASIFPVICPAYSYIQLSYNLVTSSLMLHTLKSWHASGYIVFDGLEGLLWHEFGWVLLNSLVLMNDPHARDNCVPAQVMIDAALVSSGLVTTVSRQLAASQVSRLAMRSPGDLIAEAVADWGVHGLRAHPVSVGIVMVLRDLWC